MRKTKTEGGAPPVDPNNTAAMPSNAEALKPAETVDLLPAKYSSAANSGLTATVAEGTNNSFAFPLED